MVASAKSKGFICPFISPSWGLESELQLYGLYFKGLGYLEQTRGNLGLLIVAIASQNESYEVILKYIWGTVMILNLKLKNNGVKK